MAEHRHVIRLTAVWERSEFGGWLRHFGCPSGLGGNARVWLVLEGPVGDLQLRLNDMPLGPPQQSEEARQVWDVTALLRGRNRLELAAHAALGPPPAVGRSSLPRTVGDIQLEIVDGMPVNNA
jgi:hypothetical protein